MSERNERLEAILAEATPGIAAHWVSCREAGLEGHTVAAAEAVDAAIRAYFDQLKALPEPCSDTPVLEAMKRLYGSLDEINAHAGYGLLETDERELLVPVFVDAAAACGVDPEAHDGEPGGEYREF